MSQLEAKLSYPASVTAVRTLPSSSSNGRTVSKQVHLLDTLANMKDTGLRIRVQCDLLDRFVNVCQAQDKPAAQVLREFIGRYVDEHQAFLANVPLASFGRKSKSW